jgi:hypothetical protein
MKTLLRSVQKLVENVTVTDRQEADIEGSTKHLTKYLQAAENLFVERVFTNGSYERDTIIRPLDDIDLFAVLSRKDWQDENGNLPNPQAVLTGFKTYLDGISDYKGKVKQDRPCVTVELSKKDFDILPSFQEFKGGYLIPNHSLTGWIYSFPEKLSADLNSSNQWHKELVKPAIRAVKHWNVQRDKLAPSYHIEETAISIFNVFPIFNIEEAIRIWFDKAESYLDLAKFDLDSDYQSVKKKIAATKTKLNKAFSEVEQGRENEALRLWKEEFGGEFPILDTEEALKISKALTEGTLKISAAGGLNLQTGKNVPASKGMFGEE